MSNTEPVETGARAPSVGASTKIFLSYRRDDSAGDARLLYERLFPRFGAENVFFDAVSLQPGMNWLKEIDTHDASCGVFIALIGRRWISNTAERMSAAVAQPIEDVVKREIEFALTRNSGVRVLPILIDDAAMPAEHELPRSIRALAGIQAVPLRHAQFDQDLANIITVIQQLPATPEQPPPDVIEQTIARPLAPAAWTSNPVAGAPDARHFEEILMHMVDEGALVVLLGSRVNGSQDQSPTAAAAARLPDADALAADLARRFHLATGPDDLAAVAQEVYVTSGKPDLYRTLRQLLTRELEPSALHQFLACLPGELEHLNRPNRCQLIVTTNYDDALERAFDERNVPYDMAIYMASGPDAGRFVHFPYDGDPEPVAVANRYGKFPIDDYGDLTRTVILKIHGAVDGSVGDYRWRENYVITEDQYIDYLSRSPIENLLPVQLLDKLKDSHWLFLGYTMRDWNLRVFLNRIWKGQPLGARSWAIERDPDEFEKRFWGQVGVELFASPLVDYIAGLSRHLNDHDHLER